MLHVLLSSITYYSLLHYRSDRRERPHALDRGQRDGHLLRGGRGWGAAGLSARDVIVRGGVVPAVRGVPGSVPGDRLRQRQPRALVQFVARRGGAGPRGRARGVPRRDG